MLLRSERITCKDQEIWDELYKADQEFYRFNGEEKRKTAQRHIESFLNSGPAVLMSSWGKDATVVAHLAVGLDIPVVHIAQPDRDPTEECDQVAAEFTARFPATKYFRISIPNTGSPYLSGHITPELLSGAAASRSMFATSRWVNGLRRAERGGRQFRPAATCGISCSPIFDWSTRDVFSYLAHHDLPIHPRYAMSGGGRWHRERLRVCTFSGYKGNASGRREWEREYYGDVIRRMEAGDPKGGDR